MSNGEPELTSTAELFLWGIAASLNASRDLSFDIFVLVVGFATYYITNFADIKRLFQNLAGQEGLEPPTFGFGDRRSTN